MLKSVLISKWISDYALVFRSNSTDYENNLINRHMSICNRLIEKYPQMRWRLWRK